MKRRKATKAKVALIIVGIGLLLTIGYRPKLSSVPLFLGLELSPPAVEQEIATRPFVGVSEIKIENRLDTSITVRYFLKNKSTVPANNVLIRPYYTVDGVRHDVDVDIQPLYLLPEPDYATYILRMTNSNFGEVLSNRHRFILHLDLTYDGPQTKGHFSSISALYNSYDQTFDIASSTLN